MRDALGYEADVVVLRQLTLLVLAGFVTVVGILAPVGLAAGWKCTSARIDVASDGQDVVHLGYLSPTSTYVGLEQSATKATSFVFDATVKGREKGKVDVAGTTWTTYENDAQDHRGLVRTADGATYVVVGTGPFEQLEEFASKLRAG